MITLYGIPNCDKVRLARKWLKDQDIPHEFHDFRRDGIDEKQLQSWVSGLGRDTLLNRRGTTWRQLDEAEKALAESDSGAISLMRQHPSIIRRPVIETGSHILCGFDPEQLGEQLKGNP